jgi:RNA-splicing ligase RtcB
MFTIQGKYNFAIVYTDNVEQTAISQIYELCNQKAFKDCIIRVMPDTHAGAGCTIGTTMTIIDKIVPNLVGVDIGCGMFVVQLKEKDIDLEKLDKVIRQYVPSGQSVRQKDHAYNNYVNLDRLICKEHMNIDRARKSIGTLGGGNHFIELNKDDDGNLYLVIHSGSRHLGKQIAEHYQKIAVNILINSKQNKNRKVEKDLAYLEGNEMQDYLHDMNIAQIYAQFNREAMADVILEKMGLNEATHFTTIHNYIDLGSNILRKGAIAARNGEKVLIPMNMRDGSLICIGKGNKDWNCSAPHGAGRIYSRRQAKENISLEEFQESMDGIYTTSVSQATIDESPMAYKPMDEIIENIKDTVEIIKVIKPIYNFKASV